MHVGCALTLLTFLTPEHTAAQVTSALCWSIETLDRKTLSKSEKKKKRYSDPITLLYANKLLKLAKAHVFCASENIVHVR